MSKQRIVLVVFLVLLIGGGFLRDFFMININHILKHLELGYTNYAHEFFTFMAGWSVKDIIVSKWVLTILFFFYFWSVSYVVLRLYFDRSKNVRSISYVFLTLFILAGFLYLCGVLFDIEESIYHVVRTLTGLTHSFMPAIIVFLYLKYFPEQG